MLHEARDRKASTRWHFHRRFGAAHRQRGNGDAGDRCRRAGIRGRRTARLGEGTGVRQFADFARNLQRDIGRAEDDRRKGQTHAELFERDRDIAVLVAGHRHREFTARQEFRRLARNSRQIRLSKRVDQAYLLQRIENALHVVGPGMQKIAADRSDLCAGIRRKSGACESIRIDRRGDQRNAGDLERADRIDPELLGHRTLHLGDTHLEHDLLASIDLE